MSQVYVTKPDGYREPKIGASGYAARPATTVPEVFKKTASAFPDRPAMGVKRCARNVSISINMGRFFTLDFFL